MTEKREGVELIAYTDCRILNIFVFDGHLIVATERGVYRYEHREFHPIKFHTEDSDLCPASPLINPTTSSSSC